MRRRYVIASVGLAVVLFVAISVLVARAVGVGDAQNAAVTALVRAEVRGDTSGVIALISGCERSAACRARAAALAGSLRRPGVLSVLQVQPSTNVAISGSVGTARIAWLVGSSLPRVQCMRIRDAGNVLAGFTIEILQVSGKLASDATCPSRF
ncbi:MAG TPA: hypothetical protein VG325_02240 [Solirubrobacteraceae bacterium]|nr:hypothetical protein [Solirubrobacteraceae bacterium]